MKKEKKLDTLNSALYTDKIRKEFFDYEPKRTHRFIVTLPEELNIPVFVIQQINKPKFVNGKWEDIDIEFIDLVGPSISQKLFSLTNPKGYEIQVDKRTWFDKLLGKPIFEFYIEALDPTGVSIERWTIKVDKIVSIDFGKYNYELDDLAKCRLVVKPKNCILNY